MVGLGTDKGEMVPRCMMSAKFSSDRDPSGELLLKHWIKMGQIQDSRSFRSNTLKYFKDFKDFEDLSYVASGKEHKALTIVLMLIKTNSRSTW